MITIIIPRYGKVTRLALRSFLAPVIKRKNGLIKKNTIVQNCVYFTIDGCSYCANTYMPVIRYENGKKLGDGDKIGKVIERYLRRKWPKSA